MAEFFFKNWHHFKQVARYVISGGTAAVVNLALLYFLTDYLAIWYLFSAALSYVVSFFVSFFLQKFWTFRDNRKDQINKQLMIYAGIAGFGLCFNVLLMYFLVDILHIWYMFSQIIVGFLLAFCNFLFYKFFVFSRSTQESRDDKLKILIATGIYPPDLGGPATLLTELPGALKVKGLGVKIITYSDVTLSEREKQEKMVYRISRRQCSFCYLVKYFWQMWRLSFWCDIIYATDTYSVGYFAYLIKKLTGKKYILRFAGDSAWEKATISGWTKDYIVDFENKEQEARAEKLKNQRRRILKNADKIIAVSRFMADLARKIGVDNKKISVIYNAVDFFGEQPQKIKSLSPTLVFAGRLMPWKGVEALLSVVAELKNNFPNIIFEILGDGPEFSHLKEVAQQLNIEQNVKFRGRVSELDSHKIFARSTIFVLNTNYEGLPHSVLNAMRAGLPVITTPVGGNPEVVQDGVNGLLVAYNNELAWQEAISRLLGNESLREKFSQNAKKTLEKFKFEEMVNKTIETMNSI